MTYDPRAPFGHLSRERMQPPVPPPPPPPGRTTSRWLVAVVIILAVLVIGLAAALVTRDDGDDTRAPAEAAAPTARPTTTEQGVLDRPDPTPEDFTLAVTILSKQCFGTAGCNVTYTIELTTSLQLDPDVTYQVIYEVAGGEDGPVINNLEVTGDTYEHDPEEFVGIASSDVELTATVTSVRSLG